ncbi:uncharacterized protein LOC112460789 isoform X2 [Temnothorax curvispinosus]|nr:uncharacterized protein LOC112460789 isoform X2 [Temnothorax curvispinosus]
MADRKNKDGCSINQQSARQKENSPEEFNDSPKTAKQYSLQTSSFYSPLMKNLQPNNNVR